MNNLAHLPLKLIETLPSHLVLLGYRGSQAHGTYTPPDDPDSIDDIDLIGIFVGEKEHYLGFGRRDTIEQWVDQYDTVHYEMKKIIQLLLKSNPNVLSLLFLEDKHILYRGEIGDRLIENRDIFLSRSAYHSFCGYANEQMKKMERTTQKDPRVLKEFDLITDELKLREQFNKGNLISKDLDRPYFNTKTQQLRERKNQIQKHQGYMGHKRRELVDRFGFDTKNSAHLIRLLRMCKEFLETGYITVERSDAQDFIDIKKGYWSLDRIKEEADTLFAENRVAFDSSPLPYTPDKSKAERFCVELIEEYWRL